jgi:ABC-type multidrug transport system permease subunit
LLELAIGIGFIKLQNWARVVAIVFTGIAVLFGVLGIFGLLAHLMLFVLVVRLITLALQIWILVYLFKPHVKQAFGATGF